MKIFRCKTSLFELVPYLIFAISVFLSISHLEASWFNTHMARDLFRSWNWLELKPDSFWGPEMGWDFKRLPGPFYYFYLAILWTLTKSISHLLILKILISFAVFAVLLNQLKKTVSAFEVTLFSLLFLTMPVFLETQRNLWNPSLIVTMTSLILICALQYHRKPNVAVLWIGFLAAFLGMQIHFSVLIAFLGFWMSGLVMKRHRNHLLIQFSILVIYLLAWNHLDHAPEFARQLKTFYPFKFSIELIQQRSVDVLYHLSVNTLAIPDYDLFNLSTNFLFTTNQVSENFYTFSIFFIQFFSVVLFVLGIIYVVKALKSDRNHFLFWYLLITLIAFLISFILTQHKPYMPYRYGLCLYPVQFIFMMYGGRLILRRFRLQYFLLSAATFVSAFSVFFFLNFLNAELQMKRAHHTSEDNLELNIGEKIRIYQKITSEFAITDDEDPFAWLHGRAANKFRLKEMNWEQTQPYFSLYRSLFSKSVAYSPSLIEKAPHESYLYQLNNSAGFLDHKIPFADFQKLQVTSLPENLKIQYFSSSNQEIQSVDWKNTNLILPMAFVDQTQPIDQIQLSFDVYLKNRNRFLQMLLEDNEKYHYAYSINYQVVSVTLNGQETHPVSTYHGFFLVQNQHTFELSRNGGRNHFEIRLKVLWPRPNYSRIDLFTTSQTLPPEEIYFPQ